jgi:hypothetical protein
MTRKEYNAALALIQITRDNSLAIAAAENARIVGEAHRKYRAALSELNIKLNDEGVTG